MSDSTMSDADKIRAKRLAKLGGNPGGSPAAASLATNGAPNSAPTSDHTPTPEDASNRATTTAPPVETENPFAQLGVKPPAEETIPKAPQIKIQPRAASPAKRERDGSERPRPRISERPAESLESWQDKTLRQSFRMTLKSDEVKDSHGHPVIFLSRTVDDLEENNAPLHLNVDNLEPAITEAASKQSVGKPFEYLLQCFKRLSRATRSTKYSGPDDPKHEILREARRLCMSYCIFAVTIPDMFEDNADDSDTLANYLLADPDNDSGICTDFLNEASSRFDDDDGIKEAFVGAVEELSRQLSQKSMLDDYQRYIRALRNLIRYPKIVDAITQSALWIPEDIEPQDIETKSLLGPFFRLSPMHVEVAQNYFSAPQTRDRGYIAQAQSAVRTVLRTHHTELFTIANDIVRSGPTQREAILNWFALCVNKNHKKRAMRVDHKTVASDGFMVNVTCVLDQLCEPFMDAKFGKIDRIDVDYLRRSPRVDISDETKINADQKTADDFYSVKAEGTSNFISEVFFLTVAAHHYGTEAAQTRLGMMRKSIQRMQKDLEQFESERHKYLNDQRYLQRFDAHVARVKKHIDDQWSIYHATNGALLDDLTQGRSMQFMRYVIVWLLRLASQSDVPKTPLQLPLPDEQPTVFKCLPEYFLEGITDNFKFITLNLTHILTPQQCEELIQICVAFLRNSEYVKNPGIKSGLVTILFYGSRPIPHNRNGILGDLLLGSSFANKHLLRALMKFYIEAESTGTHTQFFDKFNIRYEIFGVIKTIWPNTLYRETLAKEAKVNTDFFVQFVNMLLNDVTFVLDECFSSFVKINELQKEIANAALMQGLTEEQRKEKEELLEDNQNRAKSYMGLTKETIEMLILFSESLAESFTMPEIVTRLADMLDYNLDSLVGPKRKNLIIDKPADYGFVPQELLSNIVTVYINLSARDNFVHAIARDGRSYKPANFDEAKRIMKQYAAKSPEELLRWDTLVTRVAEAKAADEAEEEDLDDPPDEFLDPVLAHLMSDPVILPSSRTVVDRSTIRSHLLSDPTDPFNRAPLKVDEVIPDTALKERIEAWKVERKEEKRKEREAKMDTS